MVVAALALLWPAAAAGAATVELVPMGSQNGVALPPWLRIAGGEGSDDLRLHGARVTATTELHAGPGCHTDAPGSVACDPGGGGALAFTRVDLRGGDDRFEVVAAPPGDHAIDVKGGPGDDTLVAYTGSGTWDGESGADRILGGRGWTISYRYYYGRVDISLDGVANDGEPGERDDVGSSASLVIGGGGPDRLRGGDLPVELEGKFGDDVLEAGSARAELYGDEGRDLLLGGAVGDRLEGGEDNDVLVGGGGNDALNGARGADRSDGGDGNDVIALDPFGDRRPDVAVGGPGRDLVAWDETPAKLLTVDLSDDRGPDGLAGEQDAIAGGIEDVRATAATFAIVGSDGPNVLVLAGEGAVDGRGGDDVLFANVALEGDVGVIGGAGADRIETGRGARVDARDGGADVVRCHGQSTRDLRLDAGVDRTSACAPAVVVNGGEVVSAGRRRPGARVRFDLICTDWFNACRASIVPRLVRPGTGRGPALAPLALTIPASGARTGSVRLPVGTSPGRRLLRLDVTTTPPWLGVPRTAAARSSG
ncbi:MAG TPA: calcium-binding protein [Solirubrobacteraceae bacterium]|jgi:hypothetical protein